MEAQSSPEWTGGLHIQDLLIEAYRKAFEEEAHLVPSSVSACAIATLELAQNPAVEERIMKLLSVKQETAKYPQTFGRSYLFNGWLRSHQEQMIDRPDYPHSYTYRQFKKTQAVEAWKARIWEHLFDPPQFKRLMYVYSHLPTMSPVSERYRNFAVQIQCMRERLNREMRVLDIGPSVLQGLKRLMLSGAEGAQKELAFFRPPEVIVRPENYDPSRPNRNIDPLSAKANIDAEATQRFHRLQNRNNHIAEGYGVDALDITNPMIIRWARSNRLADEWEDPVFSEQYNALEKVNLPGLKIVRANFASSEEVEAGLPLRDYRGYFDAAFICLALYQSDESARSDILANLNERVNDDGWISVQDFAGKSVADPGKLVFYDKWVPYSLSTFMWDKRNPGEWQQMFDAEDGRVTRLCYGLGTIAVAGTPRSVEEMIEAAL